MFTVLSKDDCIWCKRVCELLADRGFPFEKWEPSPPELRAFMLKQGYKTVPQVFHDGEHIGGYEAAKTYLELLS